MCFVTHNRLILVIAVLSIGIGLLTFVTSSLVIHNAHELSQVTVHINFLIACTFCTIGAGLIQTTSSLLFLFRRLITRHWISTNAVVFGIFLLGICTAMVRFQSTLPEGFDPAIVKNMTNSLPILITTTEPYLFEYEDVKNETFPNDENMNTNMNMNMTSGVEDEKDSESEGSRDNENDEESEKGKQNEKVGKSGKAKLKGVQQAEKVLRKATILKLYFGSIMADFLALPIFLGLVSSKASKYELRGKSLIETSW